MMQFFLDLLPGLGLTILLWVAIIGIGFPLGLLFGYGLATRIALLRYPILIIVNIARGFPGLLVLYFVYSGLPDVGIYLTNVASVIYAFAFVTAGYTAGIFRAAIQNVPRAQLEAGFVLGLSAWKLQRLVVLPQALRIVLPPLVGFSVIVLQATSLGYAVGIRELTGLAYNLGSITFEALAYMMAAGVIYLVLCVIISQFAALLNRRRKTGSSRPPRSRGATTAVLPGAY